APAHFNLGTALAVAGQNDHAIDEYRQALALRPDYAQAHNNLAGALMQQRKFADAVVEYRAAVKADPKYVEAYGNMARAYAAEGDVRAAAKSVEPALKLNRPEPVPSALRAQLTAYRQ